MVPPLFADPVALIRGDSPCRIHPLVAQSWTHRLRRQVVIGANAGFREGFVHFAARSATVRESTAIEWLPFELNPDMPAGGMERADYRARKFGPERSAQLDAQMAEFGRHEGIDFAFDRMTRTPSTRRAHMLIAAASQHGRADPVVDALFRAYFEEGRDVGDPDILREIGVAAGLDRAVVDDAAGNEQPRQLVEAVERQAAEMQVAGVLFFIVDRKWAVSGAQPTAQWLAALAAA
ncbi:DsbA family oxidoreductase [Methylobacterium terricola]|uniref:DsbA family oxidoreductase n=2 Tax=Methylobacterium terricola TaxID=2583531 RepID=A0A5C4LPL2_9HYPH|nr:DsbA family oxidoreductase [Methylobacterium terricola]